MIILRIMILSLGLILFGSLAYAADCNSGGRYEDNGNGTVVDCRSGLVWLKNAKCTGSAGGALNPNGYLGWHDAMKFVSGLHDPLCGLTDASNAGDWRLPTITEWRAMVEYAKQMIYSPTLTNAAGTAKWTTNGDAFDNVQNYFYWSSTVHADGSQYAFEISLTDGTIDYFSNTEPNYVWPVRGVGTGSFGSVIIQ